MEARNPPNRALLQLGLCPTIKRDTHIPFALYFDIYLLSLIWKD